MLPQSFHVSRRIGGAGVAQACSRSLQRTSLGYPQPIHRCLAGTRSSSRQATCQYVQKNKRTRVQLNGNVIQHTRTFASSPSNLQEPTEPDHSQQSQQSQHRPQPQPSQSRLVTSLGQSQERIDKPFNVQSLPPNAEAVYYTPTKLSQRPGAILSCTLQLRSYSTRNVELMADIALRAAFYLNLSAIGPIPLPKIIERWTVPRSNFIFKKSQENYERITLRRQVQIWDGQPEGVELWLAFLRKHSYHGVGLKADVWDNSRLGNHSFMAGQIDDLLTGTCRGRLGNGCNR